MSISTKRGDKGETALVRGGRVSKADLRIEAYGALDELGSVMGFARSICPNERVREATKSIQKELFHVSASLEKGLTAETVDRLTKQVEEIENIEGIVGDWALPGESTASAAYDIARTVCRRAERVLVRLRESGEKVDQNVLAYVNRLSDLLWLFGRLVEKDAGIDSRLREGGGPNWSRAW
ncbi:MAG TPA: cob(I)yrinic acid a,c-diamide adenosyltransferase [Vicinamibacteria bacterium]|nr:cob(I)yrinic acid a,c-diamide adenosyltransferase [Vicinamibacteria bacterium]